MSDVTVLITKHNELSVGIIYSVCFFVIKITLNLKAKEFGVSAFSVVLVLYTRLGPVQVLLLVQNVKTVSSKFDASLLALNHLLKLEILKVISFWM